MNDRAREALVAAALSGVKQIKGAFADDDGGRCALGVLIDAWQKDNALPIDEWAEISAGDAKLIQDANDILEWDFLTIARKIGVKEEDALVA